MIDRLMLAAAASAVAIAPMAFAAADRYACTVAPTSTYSQNTLIALPLAGTWIGNYDAVTNPTGTQTRPGLFGGSGNVAIPFSSVVRPRAVRSNSRASKIGLKVSSRSRTRSSRPRTTAPSWS